MVIVIVLLIILMLGGLPTVTPHNFGYYPSGGIGLILVILLIFLLLGRL